MQMIVKFLMLALAGYLVFAALLFFFQRKVLYYPYHAQFNQESASREGLAHWPSQQNFRGFIGREPLKEAKGTVVVFHGNAGAAFHRSYYLRALSRYNMRVILAEYPGYGGREGRISEKTLVEDGLQTVELVHQQFGGPLFVWGESLGCGVAARIVKESTVPVEGAVLLLPWDSLAELAQSLYWYFPARWLVLDRYNNIENLQGFAGKIAVLLAENDEIVPLQHGQHLYDSITTTKKQWIFKNSGHNDFPVAPGEQWWKEVVAFMTED